MILLVDVGNTQTVIGVTEKSSKIGEYHSKWRISTNKSATSDDILSIIEPLFELSGKCLQDVEAAAICSVVPKLEAAWRDCISAHTDAVTVKCDAEAAQGADLLICDYPRPEEIGGDRIADAIAVKMLYGCPAVVVDFGTATNMEVVDKNGRFIGGVICPGISTSSEALFMNASKIQAVSLDAPEHVIGKSTHEALCSGVVIGQTRMVDGLLESIFDQLGYRAKAVGTGGLVDIVGAHCENITDICRDLTIDGLRILVDHSQLS